MKEAPGRREDEAVRAGGEGEVVHALAVELQPVEDTDAAQGARVDEGEESPVVRCRQQGPAEGAGSEAGDCRRDVGAIRARAAHGIAAEADQPAERAAMDPPQRHGGWPGTCNKKGGVLGAKRDAAG